MPVITLPAGLRKLLAPFGAKPRPAQLAAVPIAAEACRTQPNFALWSTLCVIAALALFFVLVAYRCKKQRLHLKKKAPPSSVCPLDALNIAETPNTEDVLSAAVTQVPSPVLEATKSSAAHDEPDVHLPEQTPVNTSADASTPPEEPSTFLVAVRARAADVFLQATNDMPPPSSSAPPFSLDNLEDLQACQAQDLDALSACLAAELEKAKAALARKLALEAAPPLHDAAPGEDVTAVTTTTTTTTTTTANADAAAQPVAETTTELVAKPAAKTASEPVAAPTTSKDAAPLEAAAEPKEESPCAVSHPKCSPTERLPPLRDVYPGLGRREGLALVVAGSVALLAVGCLRRGR